MASSSNLFQAAVDRLCDMSGELYNDCDSLSKEEIERRLEAMQEHLNIAKAERPKV